MYPGNEANRTNYSLNFQVRTYSSLLRLPTEQFVALLGAWYVYFEWFSHGRNLLYMGVNLVKG